MDEKNINSQEQEINESFDVNDVQPEEIKETKKSSKSLLKGKEKKT